MARTGITRALACGAVLAAGTGARGEIVVSPDAVASPFDHAVATLEWGQAPAGLTGFVRWTDAATPNVWTNAFDIASASPGDTFVIPHAFGAGESFVLTYAQDESGPAMATTDDPWLDAYVRVATNDGLTYAYADASSTPAGVSASYFDHAILVLRFAQMPSPSSLAMLGVVCLACPRRR